MPHFWREKYTYCFWIKSACFGFVCKSSFKWSTALSKWSWNKYRYLNAFSHGDKFVQSVSTYAATRSEISFCLETDNKFGWLTPKDCDWFANKLTGAFLHCLYFVWNEHLRGIKKFICISSVISRCFKAHTRSDTAPNRFYFCRAHFRWKESKRTQLIRYGKLVWLHFQKFELVNFESFTHKLEPKRRQPRKLQWTSSFCSKIFVNFRWLCRLTCTKLPSKYDISEHAIEHFIFWILIKHVNYKIHYYRSAGGCVR